MNKIDNELVKIITKAFNIQRYQSSKQVITYQPFLYKQAEFYLTPAQKLCLGTRTLQQQ